MRISPKQLLTMTWFLASALAGVLACALTIVVDNQAFANEPTALVAQASAGNVSATPQQGLAGRATVNPQACAQCYEQLQKDNRDCESLKGQDWQICREAAATAYRQCSQGC
jgi:hypothetical protein